MGEGWAKGKPGLRLDYASPPLTITGCLFLSQAICEHFHTVVLEGVPRMSSEVGHEVTSYLVRTLPPPA